MTATRLQRRVPSGLAAAKGVGQAPLALWHDGLAAGHSWEDALLDAVGAWTIPAETVNGREFVYFIEGEAFDWLAVAERLLLDTPGAAPVDEQERLLFEGRLPRVTPGRFRAALGAGLRRAHLNFFYGVVVEEALWLAVESEVVKQRNVRGLAHSLGLEDGIVERLYDRSFDDLWRSFHRERGRRVRVKQSLAEWKAFIYWCWHLRLASHDKARVASDTQKGLAQLESLHRASP